MKGNFRNTEAKIINLNNFMKITIWLFFELLPNYQVTSVVFITSILPVGFIFIYLYVHTIAIGMV
jgi:hypothetical protein